MAKGDVDVVREAYAAFSSRDWDRLAALMAPDVVADMSRSIGPEKGVYEGIEGVRGLIEAYWEAMETFEVEPTELIESGRTVVAVTHGHGVGRASGATAEAHAAQAWTLRDGRVVRWVAYQSREEALRTVKPE